MPWGGKAGEVEYPRTPLSPDLTYGHADKKDLKFTKEDNSGVSGAALRNLVAT